MSILRSCGVLLCVVNTLSGQRVAFFTCMSPVMYYVIIIHSVFNDLELVFALHPRAFLYIVSSTLGQGGLGIKLPLGTEVSHQPGTSNRYTIRVFPAVKCLRKGKYFARDLKDSRKHHDMCMKQIVV